MDTHDGKGMAALGAPCECFWVLQHRLRAFGTSRGALLRQSAVGNSRIVLPPWALSAASSPRAQQAYHLVIHTGGPGIALGPTWQAPDFQI